MNVFYDCAGETPSFKSLQSILHKNKLQGGRDFKLKLFCFVYEAAHCHEL